MSICCEFDNFLDQALRDRLVCGIKSEAVQKKLLAMTDLTLAGALQEAQGMEAAEKDSKELKGGAAKQPHSHESQCSTLRDLRSLAVIVEENILRANIRKFHNEECHHCGKQGHIAPVCRSGPQVVSLVRVQRSQARLHSNQGNHLTIKRGR